MKAIYSFVIIFGYFAFTNCDDDIDWSKVYPRNVDPPFFIGPQLKSGSITPRIVGGVEAIQHSRPHQVGLFIPVGGGNAFCGGSLISRRTVLTAAHCVDGAVAPVTVILGAHIITQVEPQQLRLTSTDIVLHPNWTAATLANDIALIRFNESITLNENITTIMLPRTTDNLYVGWWAVVSGWGRDSDASGTISPILREVTMPVITNNVCNLAYLGFVLPSNICTSGVEGRSTCSGDSGGPLSVNGVQIGVVSFGVTHGCEVGWPPAYARVTYYLPWIHANWFQ